MKLKKLNVASLRILTSAQAKSVLGGSSPIGSGGGGYTRTC